jgi:hypothetical protein
VSRQLYRAVVTARDAAEAVSHGERLNIFDNYGDVGVSANMCEALAGLGGDDKHTVELRFTWAQSRPVRDATPPVTLSRTHIGILGEAAKGLRRRNEVSDAVIRGTIKRLHREARSGPGDITIVGYVEGDLERRARRLRVHLSEEDYSRAGAAHDAGDEVIIRGGLLRHGTTTYVSPLREFQIQSPEY